MKGNRPTVIGAPYPQWKLGKIHEYPSVVFLFFKTSLVQSLEKHSILFQNLTKDYIIVL